MTLDPTTLAWLSFGLGALCMLTLCATGLLAFGWSIIGAHVVSVVAEAGKRAVDQRLGKQRRK